MAAAAETRQGFPRAGRRAVAAAAAGRVALAQAGRAEPRDGGVVRRRRFLELSDVADQLERRVLPDVTGRHEQQLLPDAAGRHEQQLLSDASGHVVVDASARRPDVRGVSEGVTGLGEMRGTRGLSHGRRGQGRRLRTHVD